MEIGTAIAIGFIIALFMYPFTKTKSNTKQNDNSTVIKTDDGWTITIK